MDAPPDSPPPESPQPPDKTSLPLRKTWLTTDRGGNAYWPRVADYLTEFAENVNEYQRKARRGQRLDFEGVRQFRQLLGGLKEVEANREELSMADQRAIEDAGRRLRQILSDLAGLEGMDPAPLLAEVGKCFSPAWCAMLRLTLSRQDEFGARGTYLNATEAAHYYTAKVRSDERLTPDEVDRLHDVVKSRLAFRVRLGDTESIVQFEDAHAWRLLSLEFEPAYRRIGRVVPLLSMRYAIYPNEEWATDIDMWSWHGPDPLGQPWRFVYWGSFWDELRRRAEAAAKELKSHRAHTGKINKPKPSEQPAKEQGNDRYWVWALHPLENDHTPNMMCGQPSEPGRIVQSYRNASHGGIIFASPPSNGWLVGPRFYRPTAGELDVLRKVFPNTEPDNPSWPHVEAELIAHGHSRADLQQMQAPSLIRLLAKLSDDGDTGNLPVTDVEIADALDLVSRMAAQLEVDSKAGASVLFSEWTRPNHPPTLATLYTHFTRTSKDKPKQIALLNVTQFVGTIYRWAIGEVDKPDVATFRKRIIQLKTLLMPHDPTSESDEQQRQQWARADATKRHAKLFHAQQNFRWPMYPLRPGELERYTTLDGIITSCRANAGAYTPTLGDRADFARLFPDDDVWCPPWERMRAELIGANYSFPIAAADMKSPDVLKAIAAVRATRTEPETTPALTFVPTPTQLDIIRVLQESPAVIGQVDIEQRSGHPRSVVQKRLMELEQKGLVHRPHGKRSGYTLTADGQSVIDAKSGR